MQLAKHTATVNDPNYIKHIFSRQRRSIFGEKVIMLGYILIFLTWLIGSFSYAFNSAGPFQSTLDYLTLILRSILYLVFSAPLAILTIVLGTVIIDFFLAFLIYLISQIRPLLFKKRIAEEELWEQKRNEVVTDIDNLSRGVRDAIARESQLSNYHFLLDYQKIEPGIGQPFLDYYEKAMSNTTS